MKMIILSALLVGLVAVASGCDDKPLPGPPYTVTVTPTADPQKPPALPPAPK
jgi:hypothetical protein